MSLFVIVSNGSFNPMFDRWKTLRRVHNITEVKSTKTQEAADSWIVQFAASSYDPCKAKNVDLKEDELAAYGCFASLDNGFSIAQAYKANIVAVSTSDYHLAALVTSAFLSNPSRTNATLVFFIPKENTSKRYLNRYKSMVQSSSAIVISNADLGEAINEQRGRVLFVAQTEANVNAFMKSSEKELQSAFKRGRRLRGPNNKNVVVFEGIKSLNAPKMTSGATRAVVLDADSLDNVYAFFPQLGLSRNDSTHEYQNQA